MDVNHYEAMSDLLKRIAKASEDHGGGTPEQARRRALRRYDQLALEARVLLSHMRAEIAS